MTKRLFAISFLLLCLAQSGEPQERRAFTKDIAIVNTVPFVVLLIMAVFSRSWESA